MFRIVKTKTLRRLRYTVQFLSDRLESERGTFAHLQNSFEKENFALRERIADLNGVNDPKPCYPGGDFASAVCPRCATGFRFRIPERCPNCNQKLTIPTVEDAIAQLEDRANAVLPEERH